jgi:hypothetical protein
MLKKRALAVGLLSGGLLFGGLLTAPMSALAHTCLVDGQEVTLEPFNTGDTHVNICHSTGSATQPFVIIEPDVSGACHHLDQHFDATSADVFPDAFLAQAATLCANVGP